MSEMMRCPKCGQISAGAMETSEHTPDSITRIRECVWCGFRFNTIEYVRKEDMDNGRNATIRNRSDKD